MYPGERREYAFFSSPLQAKPENESSSQIIQKNCVIVATSSRFKGVPNSEWRFMPLLQVSFRVGRLQATLQKEIQKYAAIQKEETICDL
jgi:hypothetical protein